MRKLKVFVIGLLVGLLIGTSALGVLASTGNKNIVATFRNIKILINGKQLATADEQFIYNNRTYVPLRAVSDGLGQDVEWNNATNTVSIGHIPTTEEKRTTVYMTSRDNSDQFHGSDGWSHDEGLSALGASIAGSGYKTNLQESVGETGKYVSPDKSSIRGFVAYDPIAGELSDVYTAVRDGANAILVVPCLGTNLEAREKISDLFGVSVVLTSDVIPAGPVSGSNYCSLFDGLTLNLPYSLNAYLVATGASATVIGKMNFGKAGELATAVVSNVGKGKCLVLTANGYDDQTARAFMSDNGIGAGDNKRAVDKLVNWLVTPNS